MSEDIKTLKAERSGLLEDQFVLPAPTIAGATLHPFTAGRKVLLKVLKNELLSGKELSAMEDADYAVLEFLYLHTLSAKEATVAVYGSNGVWKQRVVEFACKCTPSMDDEVRAVMSVLNQAKVADVEIEQKPKPINSSNDPSPPPN